MPVVSPPLEQRSSGKFIRRWNRSASQRPGSGRWNPKKSKTMERESVQPQEIENRRPVVLNNSRKSRTTDKRLVQLRKIQKCESAARYNEEKSGTTKKNPKTADNVTA